MIEKDSYELHFSGHETFPLRQMWLKKVCEQADAKGIIKKSLFTDDDAITRFGVGKNMVASMRHWALATGILDELEDKSIFQVSYLGQQIFSDDGWDPYSEHAATAWLIHWQLAGERSISPYSKHRSSTWYILFNTYITPEFTTTDIANHIKKYIEAHGDKNTADITIKRDVETCIKGYSPSSSNKSIEDTAEPMLAELELIKITESGLLSFRRGPKSNLPDGIFDYTLMNYWQAAIENGNSLSLDEITYAQGSPGRVFKLDEESVAERLFGLEKRTNGVFAWTNSSGIRQITKNKIISENQWNMLANQRLEDAYL